MAARSRKFMRLSRRETHFTDMGRDGTVRTDTVPCDRRLAVLNFLNTLKPSDVYAVMESYEDGRKVEIVYYQQKGE